MIHDFHTGVSTFANRYKPTSLTKVCKRAYTSPNPREEFQNFSLTLKRKN